MASVSVFDFKPGADAYEYCVEGSQFGVVAELSGPKGSLVIEPAGEVLVVWRGRRFAPPLPRQVVEAVRAGEAEELLNPWFAVRLVVDGRAVDDVEVLDRLPAAREELVGLLENLYARL